MRSSTAQKGKMKNWLKNHQTNKQTNTYWTCPSQGLNAVQRIAPRLISQASTFVTIMAVNCRKNMQECFCNWTCFHIKGVLFVLYHLLSYLRILVDLRESNSYRSVSDVPFPQHNLIKNQLFTHDMNGTKKEETEWSQSPRSLSLLQSWGLPGKCQDLKQTAHRAMCCGVFCLKQTCMLSSHSLSSEKEDVFITCWLSSKPA